MPPLLVEQHRVHIRAIRTNLEAHPPQHHIAETTVVIRVVSAHILHTHAEESDLMRHVAIFEMVATRAEVLVVEIAHVVEIAEVAHLPITTLPEASARVAVAY